MSKEDLLKLLKDAGLEDDAIVSLLKDLLADFEKPAEEEKPADDTPAETDEEKMKRVFGI